MISTTRQWLRRHRTKFAIGFGVIGVGYLAGQYVISKISEARDRMAGDRIAKDNLRRRFQQNQEDCTITVLELLPTVTDDILEALPAEGISKEIQQKNVERSGKSRTISEAAPSDFSSGTPSLADDDGRSMTSFQSESYVHASQLAGSSNLSPERPPKTKVQLWNDLKITSITRVFTLIYTLALLSLLTRIQLNLLGRKNYLASVIALASQSLQEPTINLENHDDDNVERAYGDDFEVNRKYLTFSWWLLHRGWRDVLAKVQTAVKDVFGPVRPSEELNLERLSGLILDVRRKVEGLTPEERRNQNWISYLLPPQDQEDSVLRESGVSTTSPFSSSPPPPQTPTTIPSPPVSPLTSPSESSAPPLRRLLDETSDLIESPLFTHVITLVLDAAFSRLTDDKIRSEAFRTPPGAAAPSTEQSAAEALEDDSRILTAKLASVMAVMTREARAIGRGVPNEYVQAMDTVGEVEGFAAVVYSENLDIEGENNTTIPPFEDESGPGTGERNPLPGPHHGSWIDSEAVQATTPSQSNPGFLDSAAGYADTAWSGFESVWGQVTGR